jgi:hypothetical protein
MPHRHVDKQENQQEALLRSFQCNVTNIYRKVVEIDLQKHSWNYQFSIDQALIVKSAPINIGVDRNNSLGQFKHVVMTQNFRQTMNTKDGFQWVAMRDSGEFTLGDILDIPAPVFSAVSVVIGTQHF